MPEKRIVFDSVRAEEIIRKLSFAEKSLEQDSFQIQKIKNSIEEEMESGQEFISQKYVRNLKQCREQIQDLSQKLYEVSHSYVKWEQCNLRLVEQLTDQETMERSIMQKSEKKTIGFLSDWKGQIDTRMLQNDVLIMEDWLEEFLLKWTERQYMAGEDGC